MAPVLAAQRTRLIVLSITAVLGGFAEAGTLVLIARVAFALTSPDKEVTISAGPIGPYSFSVGILIVFAAALVIVRMALQAVYTVLANRTTADVVLDMRTTLVRRFLAAGWSLQSAQRDGRLQEFLTTYTTQSSQAVASLAQAGISGFNLGALLITALFINAVASIAAVVVALGLGLLIKPLRSAIRRRARREAGANLEFATAVTETTASLQEVRIFGVSNQVGDRLEGLATRHRDYALSTAYAGAAVNIAYQGAALLLMVGALGIAYAAEFGRLASLGAIVLIVLRSLSYAQNLQSSLQTMQQSAPYIEMINNEASNYGASAMRHGGSPVSSIPSVGFEHVSFEYERGVPVLRDITFHVERGETIGIVGPSGSGKSTLIQLLLRLREPIGGTMTVGCRDARELDLDDWYRLVSMVPQDAHLFAGSIAENIRFFRSDIDSAALERAAKLAHIHEEIMQWPGGYETFVGERGGQLSGGQRQRLCIARALVEAPELIVFDEPTSALDVRSEALVRETIADLGGRSTVFIIAHRLSTLAMCDRIMVLLGGALEGFDAPKELERSNPFYREALKLSGMLT
jgi:ABC-type multidrug transport system fused ATPase/permease subunit